MPARFVVIEGIDQSGKKTQTKLLLRRLRSSGLNATALSFPVYETPSGRQIRAFLYGQRRFSWEVLHMLYSLNRWENREQLLKALDRSDFVIADRYTPSNLAYGTAHGLSAKWIARLDQGLPEPDLVIILDVPVHSSFERKKQRRDLHESNKTFLQRVQKSYRKLALQNRWQVIRGTGPAELVHRNIWQKVRKIL